MKEGLIDLLKSGVKVGEYFDSKMYHDCLVMSFGRESNHILTNAIFYTCLGVSPIRCATFSSLYRLVHKSNQVDAYKVKMLEKYKDDIITTPLLGDMHIVNSCIYVRIVALNYVKFDYSGRIDAVIGEHNAQRQCKNIGFEIVGKLKRKVARNILEVMRENGCSNLSIHSLISPENIYRALTKYATE